MRAHSQGQRRQRRWGLRRLRWWSQLQLQRIALGDLYTFETRVEGAGAVAADSSGDCGGGGGGGSSSSKGGGARLIMMSNSWKKSAFCYNLSLSDDSHFFWQNIILSQGLVQSQPCDKMFRWKSQDPAAPGPTRSTACALSSTCVLMNYECMLGRAVLRTADSLAAYQYDKAKAMKQQQNAY
jgi:hypothetical protein